MALYCIVARFQCFFRVFIGNCYNLIGCVAAMKRYELTPPCVCKVVGDPSSFAVDAYSTRAASYETMQASIPQSNVAF